MWTLQNQKSLTRKYQIIFQNSVYENCIYEPTSDRKQSLYIPSWLQTEVTQEELTSL